MAIERKKDKQEAHGEIETGHPGYLGSQDTYYIGNVMGVGRIYQQTFIDTYSRVAFVKLYTSKHAITSADFLNDRILPFFEEQQTPLMRILTDRGTELKASLMTMSTNCIYISKALSTVKPQVCHPQTNGICERLHRIMQEEFYAVAFRKKMYNILEEMQHDADEWMNYYNNKRPHSGRYCFGKTPVETFRESLILARQKLIGHLTPAA